MVSYAKTNGILYIFVGNAVLAEIEDGEESESFVEEVLNGMGYKWNKDGTIYRKGE